VVRSLGRSLVLVLVMTLLVSPESVAQTAGRALSSGQASRSIAQSSHQLLALQREWRARKGAADLLRSMALFDEDAPSSRVLSAPRVRAVNGIYTDQTVGFEAVASPGSDLGDARAIWPEWFDDAISEVLREAARQKNRSQPCRAVPGDGGSG